MTIDGFLQLNCGIRKPSFVV